MQDLTVPLIVTLGVCNLGTALLIHYYEDKMKKLESLKNHYVELIQNQAKIIESVDVANNSLISQNKQLKAQLAGDSKGIQYESSVYKSNTWESSLDNFIQEDIDFDQ